MKRMIVCLCVWSAVAIGVAQGVPARSLYLAPAPPAPPPLISLAGTTWSGQLYSPGEQVTFHEDGTLTYGSTVKGQGSPGIWRLTGNQLYFEINKWSEYETIVQGDVISGKGWNKGGQKCQPLLKRVHKDMSPQWIQR